MNFKTNLYSDKNLAQIMEKAQNQSFRFHYSAIMIKSQLFFIKTFISRGA